MRLTESIYKYIKEDNNLMNNKDVQEIISLYSKLMNGLDYKISGNQAIFDNGVVFYFTMTDSTENTIEYYYVDDKGTKSSVKYVVDDTLVYLAAGNDYKKEFTDYCKGKIKDLGFVSYKLDPEDDEKEEFQVVMIGPDGKKWLEDEDGICQYWNKEEKGLYLVAPPGETTAEVAARMNFKKIDESFYNNTLEYWDDIGMDFFIKEIKKEKGE